jgi:Xaa-Pro aminopeptidase
MMSDLASRLKGVRRELKKRSLDSLLVSDGSNVTYLSGFTGSDSVLLITPDSQFFLTDSRYIEEARSSVKGFAVTEISSSTYETIGTIVRKNRIKKLGFEAMNLPYQVAGNLKRHVGGAKLAGVVNLVEGLRMVKDSSEIALIKASVKLTRRVLKEAMSSIEPGKSERSISSGIECAFLKAGAKACFQTIVACGHNSSKPHAHPTLARIAKNDAVMIDVGCSLDSYCSDMTRMAFVGSVKNRIKEIYSIVKTAQDMAIDAVRPGKGVSEIDSAGRRYIESKGYGRFFGHSMGHGVGLDVHEEPSISRKSAETIKPGMVFTVEPAIYIPGLGGVRIEDMVLVTEKGCRILTR